MNLKKLEAFYLTAKYGSCSQAADKLLVSQPAVSMQIRDLERFYGVRLFMRLGKDLKLTEEGQTLYADAEKIFELSALAENHLLDLQGKRKSVLTIGTTPNYSKRVLPGIVSLFQSQNPQVKVVVRDGTASQMFDGVLKMENELAIVPHLRATKGLSSIPFRKEEVFLIVGKTHKWFEKESGIDVDELAGETLSLRGSGSAVGELVLKVLKKHNVVPNILLEGATEFIKEMVKTGKTISFLDRMSIIDEIEDGIFKPLRLSSERLFLPFRIFFLERESLSPPAKKFLTILKKEGLNPGLMDEA